MDQRDRSVKKEFDQKILEYKMVALQDEMSIQEDKRKRIEKFNYLKKFTNENKQVGSRAKLELVEVSLIFVLCFRIWRTAGCMITYLRGTNGSRKANCSSRIRLIGAKRLNKPLRFYLFIFFPSYIRNIFLNLISNPCIRTLFQLKFY